ncbi:MAG: outer membrane beta-barrel protein [Bacteroidetes bacterium]|nr:outer membrane beta-barrel protein [Bacteroidota bacterium]
MKKLVLFSGFWLLTSFSFAQKVKQLNLPNYDHDKLHFGFSLGFNKADFVIFPQNKANKPDSVWSIDNRPELGFNLGIISDLRLHDYVTLRFLPALAFQERIIQFKIHPTGALQSDSIYIDTKKIESTLLDFPINLKIRSERLNNVSAYLLAGGKFSIDLASQAKTENPEIIKLTNKDLAYEVGFGLDFYLEYFKLSAEMKFCAGFKDRLYHEPTTYSTSISRLFSKLWLFSLNFEG